MQADIQKIRIVSLSLVLNRGKIRMYYVLKGCPFCGKCGEIIKDEVDYFPFVPRCENPECIGHYIFFIGFRTEEEAANAWNRRCEKCLYLKL